MWAFAFPMSSWSATAWTMPNAIATCPTSAYLATIPQNKLQSAWMSQAISELAAQVRSWRQVARAIDHTLFKPEANREQIIKLTEEALAFGFAAVCVNPHWVALAASMLHGTPVKVATTIGFPLG